MNVRKKLCSIENSRSLSRVGPACMLTWTIATHMQVNTWGFTHLAGSYSQDISYPLHVCEILLVPAKLELAKLTKESITSWHLSFMASRPFEFQPIKPQRWITYSVPYKSKKTVKWAGQCNVVKNAIAIQHHCNVHLSVKIE